VTLPALAAPVLDRGASTPRLRAVRTLDTAISALWARISADHAVACPICRGEMQPEYGTGGHPVAGRCRDCDAVLS
jgi:hypothetical protein